MADLTKERGQEPVPQWAFIAFICIGIQGIYGKLINHGQAVIISNIQRTLRAYFESGSDS